MRHGTKRFIALTAALFIAALSHAQEGDRNLAEVSFESPERYEAYAEWINDTDNIRSAFVKNGGISWSESIAQWVADNVQNAEVQSDGDWRVIRYRSGGIDMDTAERFLQLISGAYREALMERQSEAASQEREKKEAMRDGMLEAAGNIAMELDRMPHGGDLDRLQESLADSSNQLLDTKLEMAELEARLDTIRGELLGEGKDAADQAANQYTDGHPKLKAVEVMQEKLARAQARVENAKQLHENGRLSASQLSVLQEAMSESELDLAKARAELQADTPNPLQLKLREMLIDAEAEFAGISARNEALEKHLDEQEALLREVQELHAEMARLERDAEELDRELTPTIRPAVRQVPRRAENEPAWIWAD